MANIKLDCFDTNTPSDDLPLLSKDYNGVDKFIICKSIDKLNALIDEIKENVTIHYISRGDWSMHDLLLKILSKLGSSDIYFSTYAIREHSVRQIINAQDLGLIKRCFLLLDSRAKTRTPEVYQLAENILTKIGLTEIHAKVCVVKSESKSISVSGSANFTKNARIEQGVITMSNSVADFHIDWITKTMANEFVF
jgi:hypothetical protein